jgi:hypothetical protein
MRKGPRGGRLREVAPVEGVDVKRIQAIRQTLIIGFSADDGADAKPMRFCGVSTLGRSKLFGLHGQKPWFK